MSGDRPKIGSFERPNDAAVPPVKTPAAETKTPDPTGATAKNLEATEARLAKEAAEAENDLKPLRNYEEALKAVKLSREEAAAIFDTYLEKGFYEREFTVSNRIKGVFRTRSMRDTKRLLDYFEAVQPKFDVSQNEIRYRYLLAASLSKIGKTVFKFPDRNTSADDREKLFEERLAFIDNGGDALFRLLCEALKTFDDLVSVALKEGAVENF